MDWYHSIVALQASAFLLSVCTEVRLDIPICSLSAPEIHSIPIASEAEMLQHIYNPFDKLSEPRMKFRRSFHWGMYCSKNKFHGFILFNNVHFGALESLCFSMATRRSVSSKSWPRIVRLPQLRLNLHLHKAAGGMRQGVAGSGMVPDRLSSPASGTGFDRRKRRSGTVSCLICILSQSSMTHHPEGLDDRRGFTHSPWRRSGWRGRRLSCACVWRREGDRSHYRA